MANCPQCKGEMGVMEPVCPHCGYDFPLNAKELSVERPRSGLAYSGLADVALAISSILTALGAILALGSAILALGTGNWIIAAGRAIAFFWMLAFFVVFERVSDMK